VHYDGTAWRIQFSGVVPDLIAVWGTSASDVFAAGVSGTLLHYDGTGWSRETSGTLATLTGVWGASGTDVFVVGASGLILHGTR